MGQHIEEIVEVQGSDPLAITRVMSQIPNNRSGKMNVVMPYVQAKLNAALLLLHRFLYRWLGGRQVFLTLNRVPVNYGLSTRRLTMDSEDPGPTGAYLLVRAQQLQHQRGHHG